MPDAYTWGRQLEKRIIKPTPGCKKQLRRTVDGLRTSFGKEKQPVGKMQGV